MSDVRRVFSTAAFTLWIEDGEIWIQAPKGGGAVRIDGGYIIALAEAILRALDRNRYTAEGQVQEHVEASDAE